MKNALFTFSICLFHIARASAGTVTFTPVGSTMVPPGTPVVFDVQVTVGGLGGFSTADVVIGLNDSADFQFVYDSQWTAAFANSSPPTTGVGSYLSSIFLGGNSGSGTASVGTSIAIGRLTIQTANLANGSYTVGVDSATDGAASSLTLGGNSETLLGTGGFDVFATCPAPFVESVGPRYFAVTPAAGTLPVALRVMGVPTDVATGCVDVFVQADGTVDAVPVFQTPDQWGTTNIADDELLAKRSYRFQTDCSPQAMPMTNLSTILTVPLWKWGDVNNDTLANFTDIQLVVESFKNVAGPEVATTNVDLARCKPDGIIDFFDILQAVNGFQNIAQQCIAPCP